MRNKYYSVETFYEYYCYIIIGRVILHFIQNRSLDFFGRITAVLTQYMFEPFLSEHGFLRMFVSAHYILIPSLRDSVGIQHHDVARIECQRFIIELVFDVFKNAYPGSNCCHLLDLSGLCAIDQDILVKARKYKTAVLMSRQYR